MRSVGECMASPCIHKATETFYKPLGAATETFNKPIGAATETFNKPIGAATETFNKPIGAATETFNKSIGAATTETFNKPIGAATETFNKPIGAATETFNKPIGAATETFNKPTGAAMETFNKPIGAAMETFNKPIGAATETFNKPIGAATETFNKPIGAAMEIFKKPIGAAMETFNKPIGAAMETFNKPIGATTETFNKLIGAATETFNKPIGAAMETFNKPIGAAMEHSISQLVLPRRQCTKSVNIDFTPSTSPALVSDHKSIMADLFVALPPVTEYNAVIFGKNSNRPASEIQDVIYYPAKDYSDGEKVKCTYIEIDQVNHTHAVILSKPSWMWGAEMGANDQGVALGNAPVWTKLNGPNDLEKKLLGTDIVRLSLERAASAHEALDVITQLLATFGQGGPCTDEEGKDGWCFHNSFLIADCSEAWLLETAGAFWVAERITDGVRNCSNELSIRTKMDLTSPGLVEEAKKLGLYSEDMGEFDFKSVFCAQSQAGSASANSTTFRYRHGKEVMEKIINAGKFGYQDMFKVLRDEDGGICMMDGGFITAGSQVSILLPKNSPAPNVHWFTGTPNPATSIYKPFFFGPGAAVGNVTVSPAKEAGAEQGERGHALYQGHKRLCNLMDTQEEKGHSILSQLRELEKKCCEDVDEIVASYDEASFPKLKQIFQHLAMMELNFYI
ncbi:Secernin-3 [Bulinus truncatus]|nr:Secernin-3 [Bulinus truncatus]